MIKKLISLTLASASTLALAGCGETSLPPMDETLMGRGDDNKTGLGGYWWTYVDRAKNADGSTKSEVTPDTGKVDPMDTETTPAKTKTSIAPGVGIEDGAFHVKGKVGYEPAYDTEAALDMDTYVDGFYGKGKLAGVCSEDTCGEMAYPTAGLGFSFQGKNAPLGAKAADKIGIGFRIKLGPDHDTDDAGDPQPLSVELPMDLTDVPDPTFEDHFGTQYVEGGTAPNKPHCAFPNTLLEDGTTPGRANKTCYRNMTTQEDVPLDITTEWKTFCLRWDRFSEPPFPPADFDKVVPSVGEKKDRLIKVQFAAFKPLYDEEKSADGSAVKFDFYVDDVYLLTEANWAERCTKMGAIEPDLPKSFD